MMPQMTRRRTSVEILGGIRYVRVDRNQQVAGARNLGILNSTGGTLLFSMTTMSVLPVRLITSCHAGLVAGCRIDLQPGAH